MQHCWCIRDAKYSNILKIQNPPLVTKTKAYATLATDHILFWLFSFLFLNNVISVNTG